jgi:hypothetical protein
MYLFILELGNLDWFYGAAPVHYVKINYSNSFRREESGIRGSIELVPMANVATAHGGVSMQSHRNFDTCAGVLSTLASLKSESQCKCIILATKS